MDWPGKLDRPLSRDLSLDRFADEQMVSIWRFVVYPEMLSLAQIGPVCRLGQVGKGQQAFTINDGKLKSKIANTLLLVRNYFRKRSPVPRPVLPRIQQDFVNTLDC